MVKKGKSKTTREDLILTIDSDSEGEVQAPESESDIELDEKKPDAEDEDLNPDFKFSLDGFETTNTTDGWEFRVIEDEKTPRRKDVNLDEILRRKGGLAGLVEGDGQVTNGDDIEQAVPASEDSLSSSEANKAEAEAKIEPQVSDTDPKDDDDDELAMDGFGMGFQEDVEKSDDETSEKADEAEEEEEEERGEPQDSDSENDEDSAEAIADFYEKAEDADDPHNTFQSLDLSRPVLKGLANLGYTKPSPIQASSIPIALMGKDIVAGAVTGSGKTAAYMIPIIERLLFKPTKIASTRVIVLTPTRELAIQVCDVGKRIGRFINNLTFGLAVGGLN
ncbi:hypothetical protein OXX79_010097, partial [Metschnikowia pulcherrima]